MKVLDLRKSTPKTAATRLHAFITTELRDWGGDEALLWSPEESDKRGLGKSWHVSWEGGPFEWAISVSLGGSISGRFTGAAEVLLVGAKKYIAEPYHSFDLSFSPD